MIEGSDLKAARLLAGLTNEEVATSTGLHPETVRRIEGGRDWPAAHATVVEFLEHLGAKFEEPGYITMPDGRRAPTIKAVGLMSGVRIRRARWRLGWTLARLASESGYSVESMKRLEAGKNLNVKPDLPLYKAIGALQLAGAVFAPFRHDHKPGDYCLVPRPRFRDDEGRPLRDYATSTRSRPTGPRGLEFEED